MFIRDWKGDSYGGSSITGSKQGRVIRPIAEAVCGDWEILTLTPVGVHLVFRFSFCSTNFVLAPLAYAVCTTPTVRGARFFVDQFGELPSEDLFSQLQSSASPHL